MEWIGNRTWGLRKEERPAVGRTRRWKPAINPISGAFGCRWLAPHLLGIAVSSVTHYTALRIFPIEGGGNRDKWTKASRLPPDGTNKTFPSLSGWLPPASPTIPSGGIALRTPLAR